VLSLWTKFYGNFLSPILAGDELLSVNGVVMQGLTHKQASMVFKSIKQGQVLCYVARRITQYQDGSQEPRLSEELQLL